jgi:lipoprotein-anchoring transpeptidase ErfK/SrfK
VIAALAALLNAVVQLILGEAIVIDTTAHTLSYHGVTYEAGTGTPDWATPIGVYETDGVYASPSPTYGPAVILTTARGRDTGRFDGTIAIHGTNKPALLPGAVSHGCIRLANNDLLSLLDAGAGVQATTTIIIHY